MFALNIDKKSMLLLEQSQENDLISFYDSSNILMSKYIVESRTLLVLFSKGHQYVYEGVLPYHYQRFKVSASQGKGLSAYIIPNYKGVKTNVILDQDQIKEIKKQIDDLRQQKV